MRARTRSILLAVCCALAATGCGSSRSFSTSTAASTSTPATASASASTSTSSSSTQAKAAVSESGLTRLTKMLPVSTAKLPPASTNLAIERKYLIALFDDAQATWRHEFADEGLTYTPAHVVVFFSQTDSPCGKAEDSGPFFCSGDRTVYLDLRFFALLARKFGVQGPSQGYIVGHEVAHNVQNLLGIARAVGIANQEDPSGSNARSVMVELQADCLAGVWGRSAYSRAGFSISDLGDATRTAKVIGDDYDAQAGGDVVDSSMWTHGSSEQRQYWLKKGFESGRPDACDTFAGG